MILTRNQFTYNALSVSLIAVLVVMVIIYLYLELSNLWLVNT